MGRKRSVTSHSDPYAIGLRATANTRKPAGTSPVSRGYDPYAVTPTDPLHEWPPPKRLPFWHPGYATGTDLVVAVVSPGSGLLLLWGRKIFDGGDEARGSSSSRSPRRWG